MPSWSRRRFLASAAAIAAAPALPGIARAAAPIGLLAERRTIEVGGKAASMLALRRADGGYGLTLNAGDRFQVELTNKLDIPTLIHWHGLTPPADQDGVPGFSQSPLEPGARHAYDFALARPGTNWMHSHVGLQEQLLLAAPLIIRDPAEAGIDEQDVVVMLHDFTFRDPEEILAELRGGTGMGAMSHDMSGMDMGGEAMSGMDMSGTMSADMPMDLNDIDFDAYLANDRTLDDPEAVAVEAGGRVRLRLINGAAATNFVIDLGVLVGTLVAVDGMPIVPVVASYFEIGIANRLDIRLKLPGAGAWPILAQREGDRARTGIVLASKGATVAKLAANAETAPTLDLGFESRLLAAAPLAPRPADRVHRVDLTGGMAGYNWTLNNGGLDHRRHLKVRPGERVHLVVTNRTGMSHPMHLHGHHFQVIALGDRAYAGAVRDTLLVPRNVAVTLAFDADNPGTWAFHCHNLYHMLAGMMTGVAYES
jgi:FtsP/CotA-like multicopper oxidase with cupredoxin domain